MSVVLVCADSSQYSNYALEYYLKWVYYSGSQIHIIYCPEDWTHVGIMQGPSPAILQQMRAEEEAKALAIKTHCEQILAGYQVPGQFETVCGKDPWEIICKQALALGASLIVMGSRGKGKLRRTLMGSCSSSVVHHAHCPVLVCRHKHE